MRLMGLRVAVFGGSGYTGGELLRLLSAHPEVGAVEASSRQHAGKVVGDVYPQLAMRERFVEAGEIEPSTLDVAFVAYPHMESAGTVAGLLEGGTKLVVDLSADFRLKNVARKRTTGCRRSLGRLEVGS
jgi:N-acetyl-gamma-glutamylphosphate reductase